MTWSWISARIPYFMPITPLVVVARRQKSLPKLGGSQLQMLDRERDPDDRHGVQHGRDHVADREPDAGEMN